MSPEEILSKIGESAGGAFRFGVGVMGKSAVLLFVVVVVIGIAILRLDGTRPILIAVGLLVAAFFLWFFAILSYTNRHPETALLEGAEWTQWKKFEAMSKFLPSPPAGPIVADPDAGQLSEAEIQLLPAPDVEPEEPQA